MKGFALLRTSAAAAAVLLAGAWARAAAPAMADPDAARVRQLLLAGTNPAPDDKKFLVGYLKAQAEAMWNVEDTGETSLALSMEKIRTKMQPVVVDYIGGNLPFVQTMAEIYQEALLPILTNTDAAPKTLAAYDQLGIVLTSFRHPVLSTTYMKLTALPIEASGLRFRVMWALQAPAFRTEIISGANAPKLQQFLIDRCRNETSMGVMGEVFGAMDLNGQDDKLTLKLLLAGLKGRLENYFAGNMEGVGAEPRALDILERIKGSNETILNASKNEVIEVVGKLLHVAGTRYTEFSQARVDVMRIRKLPVAQIRLGVWDTVIAGDRMLTVLLQGMPSAGTKNPQVEKAFVDLMTAVSVKGGTLQDPVENLYGPDNVAVYRPFLQQLDERKQQVIAVLRAAKHGSAEIPEPKEWKVSADPPSAGAKKDPKKPAKK